MVDREFWRGRRVLVTGHTGFKGAWLSLWLESLGARVMGYAAGLPTDPCLYELARVGEGLAHVQGDVRDLGALKRAIGEHRPEVIFHLAAQPIVGASLRDPVGTYETNVMGTVNVLEAVRQASGVRVVVNVTSDKCYENREWPWGYREYEPKGGDDPYSSSKGCAELVTDAYRRSFFSGPEAAAVASARAGNVIGGGDWAPGRLVPDMIRAALKGEEVLVRNPDSIRPWQHVLEPLGGYLTLAQALWASPEHAHGWNFGPSDEDAKSVRWLVNELSARWPEPLGWCHQPGAASSESRTLRLDSSLARRELGWIPRWTLEQALEQVVSWYRAMARGEDMRALTLAQIATYEAAVP